MSLPLNLGRPANPKLVYDVGMACRCGWDGKGQHPCHGKGYSCGKPARQYFYRTGPMGSLAGAQLKFSMMETWACPDCWADFQSRFPVQPLQDPGGHLACGT